METGKRIFELHLKSVVTQELGLAVANRFLSKALSVDFWLEHEHTIIVLEFNMLSSAPLLEREALKALLARDAGKDVQNLVLIGDPGSLRRHQTPGAQSIIDWMKRHHQIQVEVWELKEKGKA
jgi:hypothetical protein